MAGLFTSIKSKNKKTNAKILFKRMVNDPDLLLSGSSDSEDDEAFKEPSSIKMKNDMAHSSTVSIPSKSEPIGLINSQNICFFNSVLQSLFSLCDFGDLILNIEGPNLLKDIFIKLQTLNSPFLPISYLNQLKLSEFTLGHQYDAHECLVQLLETVYPLNYDSLFKIVKNPEILCENCKSESSSKSEIYFDLKLDILNNHTPMSIFEAIQTIQLPSNLENYRCDKCKCISRCYKSDYVQETGSLLVVNLKLFKHNRQNVYEKINPPLVIEEEMNFGGCLGNWTLNSIIYHHGRSHNNGHYTSCVKSGKSWFHIDDHKVSKVPFQKKYVKDRKSPYILFYSKKVEHVQPVSPIVNRPVKSTVEPGQSDFKPAKSDVEPVKCAVSESVSEPLQSVSESEKLDFMGHVDDITALSDIEDEVKTSKPLKGVENPIFSSNFDFEIPLGSSNQVMRCSTYTEVVKAIKDHQISNNTQYYNGARSPNFGDFNISGCQVMFKDVDSDKEGVLKFDGIPFMCTGRYYLPCTHGVDTNLRQKEKLKAEKELLPPKGSIIDHDFAKKKRRNTLQDTKKKDCKATVIVREIIFFPRHKIEKDSKHFKRDCSRKLRFDLEKQGLDSVSHEKCFIVVMPPSDFHTGHAVDFKGGISQHMDKLEVLMM